MKSLAATAQFLRGGGICSLPGETTHRKSGVTRREFAHLALGTSLAAAVFPSLIPASALGKNGAISPSNRLPVGVIGCGPQGLGDLNNFLNEKDCQVVAVCDVKSDQLELARTTVNNHYGNQDCRGYHDFRELLSRSDIDACLIATPDHWHVLAALAAVNAGKDVYVEKPLGLSLEEDRVLRTAVHRKKRVFQFGTQQRSGRMFRFACELARSEAIGKLQHINVWAPGSAPGGSREVVPVPSGWDYDLWLGPAPFTPYTKDRCSADGGKKTWWFISDYALGFIAGWGIHPMDIALWGVEPLMKGTVTVEGRGNFHNAGGVCDTATIWEIDYHFASGLTLKFVGVPNGGNRDAATGEPFLHGDEWKQRYRRITTHGTAFEGSQGWAHVDRTGINLQPEKLIDLNPDDCKVRLTASPGHVRNFLDCVKSRGETVCPVDTAVRADTLCHIGNIAIRLGRKLTFDFNHEKFISDDAADQWLRVRAMRKPWRL
jgi:predicted dehydrogenase